MSMQDSLALSFLLEKSKAILPLQYFDVREEANPKGSQKVMLSCAMLAYIGTIVAFACLFTFETKKFTTETIIISYDKSGVDGYTCEMISKVSQAYEVAASATEVYQYTLVNVIESSATFSADMAAALPCEASPTYFPGTAASPFAGAPQGLGIEAVYDASLAYIAMEDNQNYQVFRYNVTAGQMQLLPIAVEVNSLAVDNYSNAYFEGDYEGVTGVYKIVTAGSDSAVTAVDTAWNGGSLINDNKYNIYGWKESCYENAVFFSCSYNLTSLDISVSPAAVSDVFSYSSDVFSALGNPAVYSDGERLCVYLLGTDLTYQVWENGTFAQFSAPEYAQQIYVDNSNQVFFQTVGVDGYGFSFTDALGVVIFEISDTAQVKLAMDPTASTVFALYLTGEDLSNSATLADSLCIASDLTVPLANHNCSTVSKYKDFSAGWFTCGNHTLLSYIPNDQNSYSADCLQNGIVAEVTTKSTLAFTEPRSEAYAASVATKHCHALYDAVAATISNLPPYSCTRTLYQPFFTSVGTAAANAMLLYHALIFLTAMLLPGLSAWMMGKDVKTTGSKRERERDVQMTSMAENPLRATGAPVV